LSGPTGWDGAGEPGGDTTIIDSRSPEPLQTPSYLRDAYLAELTTEVVSVGEQDGRPYAVLTDTIFYPEGGGQPADHGHLGGVAVVDVQKVDRQIRHYLSERVAVGTVRLELDWPRRWDHMQQHTGQHTLTAVALRNFGWRTTAFHLGPEVSDIELDVPTLNRADLDHLQDVVAAEIHAARSIRSRSADVGDFEALGVRSRRLPEGFSGAVRLVEIAGLDLNTCGGTHCRSTAEIGALCLLGNETMRGGTRVFFVAGDRVRRRMAAHEDRNRRLRTLLGAGDDELPDIVSLRMGREKELARTARRLADELAESSAAALAAVETRVIEAHWPDRDMGFLQRVGHTLVEAAPQKCALLTSEGDSGAIFVVAAGAISGLDLEKIGPLIAEILGGRGGGRGPIFQGRADTLANRDEAVRFLSDA
jgi:alanyl-tRNA synthetase